MKTTNIIIGIVLIVLVLLIIYRVLQSNPNKKAQFNNALLSSQQIAEGRQMLEQTIKNHPRVKELVVEAKQNGATHFGGVGPAIAFYRIHDGKVEECFAEFTPGKGYHEWVWPPSEWHTGKKRLPENAKPIPDDI